MFVFLASATSMFRESLSFPLADFSSLSDAIFPSSRAVCFDTVMRSSSTNDMLLYLSRSSR